MRNLLSEFGAAIGLPELQPDEANRCNLLFDEVAVSFELSPHEDSIYLYAYLGDMPAGGPKALPAALLDANYLFQGTGGATIGVDKATGRVVMVRAVDLSALRQSAFQTLVEAFVNLAEIWQKKLADFPIETEEAPRSATPPDALSTKV